MDHFIASTGDVQQGLLSSSSGRDIKSSYYPVILTHDMPAVPVLSGTSAFPQAPKLKCDSFRAESFQYQLADVEGMLTELGLCLLDVRGVSADTGIQVLQDCIVAAGQRTYMYSQTKIQQLNHGTSLGLIQSAKSPFTHMKRQESIPPAMWQHCF